MNHETAISKAREIADRVLAPAARQNDKEARFSTEAVDMLGQAGLLG
jgi:alkylation response protein AidB-like acyl-CoA dehydrogenase